MTTDELKQFLVNEPAVGEFTPYAYHADDTVTAYFKPDADYSEKLTDEITLMRSLETGEIVGCRIHGLPEQRGKDDA